MPEASNRKFRGEKPGSKGPGSEVEMSQLFAEFKEDIGMDDDLYEKCKMSSLSSRAAIIIG